MTNLFRPSKLRASRCFAGSLLKLCLLISAAGLGGSLQAQLSSVTPYALPSGQYATTNIATLAGSLWFLSTSGSGGIYYANSVATNGTVTPFSVGVVNTIGNVGHSVAAGPDGALWFTAGSGQSAVLARITTAGVVTTYPISGETTFDNGPGGVITGPDNNLWFTDPSNTQLARYSPSTATFSYFALSHPGSGITVGPDQNIWVTEYAITSGDYGFNWTGYVASISTAGVVAFENPLPQQNLYFSNLAEFPLDTFTNGPDGALWFTEYNGSYIGRATTAGVVTTPYTGQVNGITTGTDGNLWFTQPYNDGENLSPALIRLTTAGVTSEQDLDFSSFFAPFGITSGPDGALWFNDNGYAVVGRAVLTLAATTPALPNGAYGTSYSAQLQSQGGVTPITWSWAAVSPSSLPPGLTLAASGAISGAPTAVGTFTFTATATDSEPQPQTASQQLSITVSSGSAAAITATSGGGQTAVVNTAFGSPLVAVVTDAGGNPVQGVAVTFSLPSSSAGAAFPGPSPIAVIPTNAAGVATSPAFTANQTAGGYSASATVPGVPVAATFPLTNAAAAASSIAVVSGSGQSAAINTAFGSPLTAIVKDTYGNAVSGASVTFSAPGSGASGIFSGSATVTSSAAGLATSPAFTANGTAGGYTVNAMVAGVAAPAPFSLTNTVGAAASITATSGAGQSARISTAFGSPLMATVKDSGGNPVANASVTFSAPTSGASGTFGGAATASVNTNASGVATSPAFTANGTAGGYNVNASVGGVSTPAMFGLTNTVGAAASITATSGSGQSARISTPFGSPLMATVKDSGGNPVSGATVTFSAPGSGASGTFPGSVLTAAATTNGSGVATSPAFTANGTAGGYTVNAMVAGVGTPAPFSLTNTVGTAASITATSGGGQSARISTPFGSPLVATVKDSGGNPVSGATVTFSAPGSGASGTFPGGVLTAAATTNGSGVATSPAFTANGTAGGYTVNAAVAGVGTPAPFSLTNTVGTAASITATSGSGQSAQINTPFGSPLVTTVKDSGGNAVSGATVTFSAPGSGASGTFPGGVLTVAATTNGSGVATSPAFTANGTAGGYTVNAAVAGVTTPAPFSLTNTVGTAANITATSGGGQSARINTLFGSPLVATVKDSGGNAVSGATVTFSAPGSGASGTFPDGVLTATATTNGSGVATSPAFTANNTAGGYNVSASVAGVGTPAAFGLTNTVGTAASITATAGSGQSAQINTVFGSPLTATVKDSGGNAVSGATVTFSAPGSGASGAFPGGVLTATATTNASGVATSPAFTANSTAGSYNVSASVAGASTPATFGLTNTVGTAASITATAGSGQTAQINTAFVSPLMASVKDSGGNAVSGATVTFSAPGSGASGTFPGGVATAAATTNGSGIATSPALTANSTAGGYNVTASVAGASAPAAFALTNTAPVPTNIAVTSGNGQVATVATVFASPLAATVTGSGGVAVPGATVTFSLPGSGQSGTFSGGVTSATATTNASGVATSPIITANQTAGSYSVTALVGNLTTSFALNNVAGAPASIAVSAGTPQSTQINNTFGSALVVVVKDRYGNPVSGASVTFTPPASGASGTFSGSATVTTIASGLATSPAFTANSAAGSYSVSATVGGVSAPAVFSLTNTAGLPASIAVSSGSPQSVPVNNAFAALSVIVKDSGNNPVPNVTVTFTAPASGASGSFAGGLVTATTNGAGIATSATFTANGTAGSYSVTAAVQGVTAQAVFALTNTAGAAASITATLGNGQVAQIGTHFASTLQATVKDGSGNPVGNVTVTFACPGGGASCTFATGGTTATVQTNNGGLAVSPVVSANATAGTYTATALVSGVATPASFTLTNSSGPVGRIVASGGQGQFATINTVFVSPLVVTVTDSSNNPVANATVTFTAPSTGASATFAGGTTTATASTNASGVASSPVVKANGTAGGFQVMASAPGAATPAIFTLNNTAGSAASITASSGGGQSARVNGAFNNPLVVTVKDSGGNPVNNANVTFTAPSSGASGTFAGGGTTATVATLAGVASSPMPFTANGTTGPYSVTASVAGVSTPATFALTNVSGLTITTAATLPNSIAGTAYSEILTSVGGTAPYNWTVTSGTLPAGLTLNALTGAITGTPTTAGTLAFTVTLTDRSNPAQTATKALSLTIVARLTITTATLPNGFTGQPYAQTLAGAAGSTPYHWSVSTGTLPSGLTLNALTGAISGTPTATGTYSFTVTLTDSGTPAQTATQSFSMSILAGLAITTTSLPSDMVGVAYPSTPSATLAATGGTPPYIWSWAPTAPSTVLPPGLTLSATGVISGTPTAAGTFSFVVTVTDRSTPAQTAAQPLTLVVTNTPVTPLTPTFTISGIPSSPTPGVSITSAVVNLSQPSSAAYSGTLSLSFTPNSAVTGLPNGFTGDAGFGTTAPRDVTETIAIPAGTTSVPIPAFDPGTVAGEVTVNLTVGGTPATPAVIMIPAVAPIIEANSVQINSVTSSGFDIELVASSTTRELTNATFTFTAAAGASITGNSTFTVDISSLLTTWFASNTSYQYGGAFSLTIPFTLSGSANAIGSVSVTLSNSVGTSTPVSGTQ